MSKLNNSINQDTVNNSIITESATPFLTAIGSGAATAITTGINNVAVGYNAAHAGTIMTQAVAIGAGALTASTGANGATAVGYNALASQTGAASNTAVGLSAGSGITSALYSVAVGANTLTSTLGGIPGSYNTAVGYHAMINATTGLNVAIGALTMTAVSGNENTCIGTESLTSLTSGTGNLAAGFNAGENLVTGSSNVLLGTGAATNYVGAESSNIVVLNTGVAGESNVIRIGTQGSGAGQQNVAYIVGTLNISGAITTQPVASSTATSAFVTSLTAGTSVQNTTGYDLLANISVLSSAATGATIVLGVGSTSTPTTNTVIQTFSLTALISYPPVTFSAIVPNNYYLLVNTTGTITVSSINVQSCPI